MKQHSKHGRMSRLLSLLLSLALVFSLIPTAVFATGTETGTGTGTGTNGDTGDPDYDGGKPALGYGAYKMGEYFARISLVYFPNGIASWNATAAGDKYKVIGQLDTSSQYDTADMQGVKIWYRTNALQYIYDANQLDANQLGTSHWADKFNSKAMWGDYTGGKDTYGFIPWDAIDPTTTLPNFTSDSSLAADALDNFFITKDKDGKRTTNSTFAALLKQVSNGTVSPEQFERGTNNAQQSSGAYRIFIEPGLVCKIADTKAAMTLRDMAAWDINYTGGDSKAKFSYNFSTGARELAYGLSLTSNEFTERVNGELEQAGQPAFTSVADSERKGTTAQRKMKAFFTSGADGSGASAVSNGYGLGIVIPGDSPEKNDSYVARINLFVPTELKSTTVGGSSKTNIGATYYSYVGEKASLGDKFADGLWR